MVTDIYGKTITKGCRVFNAYYREYGNVIDIPNNSDFNFLNFVKVKYLKREEFASPIELEVCLNSVQEMINNYAERYGVNKQEAHDYLFGEYTSKKANQSLEKIVDTLNTENDIKKAEETLKNLGISIKNKDGSYKSLNSVFEELSNEFDKLTV